MISLFFNWMRQVMQRCLNLLTKVIPKMIEQQPKDNTDTTRNNSVDGTSQISTFYQWDETFQSLFGCIENYGNCIGSTVNIISNKNGSSCHQRTQRCRSNGITHLDLIQQHHSWDCGVSCLQMIILNKDLGIIWHC